ncbi:MULTISPECIES: cytidine deaminase [Leuconostoc]|jgi:cytidine deaminase|uniref:Cytidine deaminase n=1 Tax=Leuconostoc pseudomesenteroides TaxID=33968 RepID=A0A5B8T0D4_LEUPS|nr:MULTISPECIES: cytidine deaminase [Leuconostoc]MBK0039547.1 cytidine deaminase [Leuconostoc sp. S51]MBK0050506.1 cytidine deaminase [Leuconostoc sp. S50]MBS0957396.1 cytidine deaminase [Leuconostoc pseudomesenteroides]MCC7668327.1 cytidine deaminase [Leuconostoc pseudomesenteroides]MCC8438769.1 cytidine deaminase [Leuconostoc pseudomesenteroides]
MTVPSTLADVANAALNDTYTPYSHFPVGAALLGENGEIFKGVNIENVSFGLTNCAERTAIFTAIAAGHRHFHGLVISGKTDEPIAPCGACRQVMVEFFEPDMPIWLINDQGQEIETNIAQLMPGAFNNLH